MMDIEAICRKLKPIIGEKADELWYRWLASDFQERKDLEIDIQLIAEKVLKHGPLQDRVILLPPPSEEQAKGDFILGKVVYRDKKLYPLYLKEEDFIKQIGIFSITGAGKTNAGLLMALQLLKKNIPFTIIDWKRQWRSMLSLPDFPELKKVEVYTVGRDVIPFLWNPFRAPPGVDYKAWLSVIVECLEKSHLGGLGVGDFIFRVYEKLFSEQKDKNFYPNFWDGMRELEKIKVGGREFLWWQTTKRIFKSFTFGPSSKSFNARKPIKLEELFEKFILLELDQEMPKPLRVFFMEIMLRFIHLYRLSQGESEKLRHVLFLEEMHNLFQKNKFEKDKIDGLENVYREIRSFGQGLVSITQHCSILPTHILGNAHTLIFLLQQHQEDIEAARKALFIERDDEAYLNMLKTGQGIVKIMERINPCLVQFLYVPVEKGKITDEWLKTHGEGYSRPASDDKGSEKEGYSVRDNNRNAKTSEYVNTPSATLLIDILKNPFLSLTQRYKKFSISTGSCDKHKRNLIEDGLIEQARIVTSSGLITLFELTSKGKAVLTDLGYEVKDDKESIIHKFWKFKIAEFYKAKGLDVLVEEHINGRPDIILIHDNKKIAVEIETGASDFIKNIDRDINSFDETICIAVDKITGDKIKKVVEEKNLTGKLTITSASAFTI